MTTYPSWTVGDVINICASLTEFCGITEQFIIVYDINVTKSPYTCTLNIGTGGSCGLHLNNVELTFSLVKGMDGINCSVAQTYKILGSVTTVSNGTAGIAYTVTEQDRLNYISATNEGYSYYVMVCITNSDGQVVTTNRSEITAPITISSATHLECVSGVCTEVTGSGTNTCTTPGSTIECAQPPIATHYIEYNFNIFPTVFNDLVSDSLIDISTLLGNYLPFPSNIQYIESKFENNRFKIYVNYTEPVQLSMNLYNNYNINSMYELSISALAGIISGLLILSIETIILTRLGPLAINPYTLGGAALIAVAGAFFTGWTIYNIPSSTSMTETGTITPEKQVADSEIEYNKSIAKCKTDHPCALNNTCSIDEAKLYDSCIITAELIQRIIHNNMAGTDPNVLHTKINDDLNRFSNRQTDLTNGLITVAQALADLAAQVATAEAEAAALKAQVTCNTGLTYNPDTKQCVKIEECAIRNPFGGCILSSKTGTTLMYIGGGLLIGYIGYKIFVKK